MPEELYKFNLKGLDSRVVDRGKWLLSPYGGATMGDWLTEAGSHEFVQGQLVAVEMEMGYICDGKAIELVQTASAAIWMAHRLHVQKRIEKQPTDVLLKKELAIADKALAAT